MPLASHPIVLSLADLLSSIEFDDSGEFLAAGDHGGRVVIFQRSTDVRDSSGRLSPEYHFYAEFQSHERKFDYLSSTEIPEKINSIRWVKTSSNSRLLLTSNGISNHVDPHH